MAQYRDELFAAYKGVRASIEHRTWQFWTMALHISLFVMVTVFWSLRGMDFAKTEFPLPQYGGLMLLWSLIVLGHSLLTVIQSDFVARTRKPLIDQALRFMLQSQKNSLVTNSDQLLTVQTILDEDLRARAGIYLSGAAYAGINALIFISWYPVGITSLHWQMSLLFAPVILLPSSLLNYWGRIQRDKATPSRLPLSPRQKAAQFSPERLAEWKANPLNLDTVDVERPSKTLSAEEVQTMIEDFFSSMEKKSNKK